jgi:creatinine amidohydrolase
VFSDTLGEQRFRWIFIVHAHGAPNHNRMLDQAGDYFRDTYGGHMVHLMGLLPAGDGNDGGLSPAVSAPGSGRPPVERAQPQSGNGWEDLTRLARAPEWPGYFGSPRLVTAASGARSFASAVKTAIDHALKILDGSDERQFPRVGDLASKSAPNIGIDKDAIARELEIEKKQQAWLRTHIVP